ncbi:hypothetical protein IW261DRAFT_1606680 [Armillaria novae-zelandiae]|uniref:F-box domain-containing protein n=1 Tax=Armillaria novae-zelandiae TaxID=153914 RepID=A0AA39PC80_9AGAR|nr:hypothetical protein IW261DRAFT_1606680 [Armillaria novae-zelandiae]
MAPLRRSQRVATKRTQAYIESGPEDDHNKDNANVAPIKKKPRVKNVNEETQIAPKRRKLRGLLQKVAETPLDVLFEIFSNLEPLDLLRLSRTTKDLRALLLRRSSSFVWKRTRENVEGLPPLPEDLSEPKFAHLAFDKHCSNCLHLTKFVQWEARTKYCRNCLETSDLFTLHRLNPYSSLIPIFGCSGTRRGQYYCYAYVPSIESVRKASDSFGEDHDKLKAWRLEKEVAFEQLRSHARQCEIWSARRAEVRSNELDATRVQRFEGVLQRLTSLGWDDEVKNPNFLTELRWQKYIRQSKALTERVWANMSDAVIALAQHHKFIRLRRQKIRAVEERMKLFEEAYSAVTQDEPLLPIIPKPDDVVVQEPFSTLFFDTPLDVSIADSLQAMWIHLPDVASKLRDAQTSKLTELMKQAGLKADLHLATTVFRCTECCQSYQYPYVLAHRCPSQELAKPFNDEDWKPYVLRRISHCYMAWSESQFSIDQETVDKVACLIKTCGLDPETATYEDMDTLDYRIICNHCSNSQTKGRKQVMRWRAAVYHSGYTVASEDCWTLLEDPEELKRFKVVEKSDKEHKYNYESYTLEKYICNHCMALRIRGRVLEEHLSEVHQISKFRQMIGSGPNTEVGLCSSSLEKDPMASRRALKLRMSRKTLERI